MLRKSLSVCGLLLAGTAANPAMAVDLNAVENALRALQPITEQWDRDAAARREREAAEAYRAAEIERQQKQRQEIQAQQAEAARQAQQQAELRALMPPPEWADRLAFHRSLLTPITTLPSQAFVGLTKPAFSPDGKRAAYLNAQGALVLRELNNGSERLLRAQIPPANKHNNLELKFASNDTLLATQGIDAAELMDLQGQRLHYWHGFAFVDANDILVHGQHMDKDYKLTCTLFSRYDTHGKLHYTIDLENQNISSCNSTFHTDSPVPGPHEVLTIHAESREATFYQDGEAVSRFRLRGEPPYHFSMLGQGYGSLNTYSDDGKRVSHQIWDLKQGRQLCELAERYHNGQHIGYQAIAGQIYSSSPAAKISLPSCETTLLPGGGRLLGGNADNLMLMEPSSGQVTVLNPNTLQARAVFTAAEVSAAPAQTQFIWVPNSSPDTVLLYYARYSNTIESGVLAYDMRTGAHLITLPGSLSLSSHTSPAYLVSPTAPTPYDEQPKPQAMTVWAMQDIGGSSSLQTLTQALVKDKYESTADYRKRLAALSMPFSMQIEVLDYDADLAQFSARWQGIPLVLPMPPAQARRLDGQQYIALNGQLQVLDENFLTLAQATAGAPDGTRIPIAETAAADEAAPSPRKRGGQK